MNYMKLACVVNRIFDAKPEKPTTNLEPNA